MLCGECYIICFVVFANGMYLVGRNCFRVTFGAFRDVNTMVYGRWLTRIGNCMQWLQCNEVWSNRGPTWRVLCKVDICLHFSKVSCLLYRAASSNDVEVSPFHVFLHIGNPYDHDYLTKPKIQHQLKFASII